MFDKKDKIVLFFVILIAWFPLFMAAWDKGKPIAGRKARYIDDDIRANNGYLETAIDQDHDFTTGGTTTGKHNKLTLMEESSDITTAANEMGIYCKDLGAAPGLYVRPQSAGTAIQWTGADAKILSAATDMLDEDDMASNSATKSASQQSIKAYVTSGTVTMTNKTLTSPVLNTGVSGTAVLDEDDMASNSATKLATQQSIKAYVDNVVQIVNTTDGEVNTGTTAMVNDDSIPQKAEGDEYMTCAITPKSATSKLKIDVVFNCSHTVEQRLIVALFQDNTSNALAAVSQRSGGTNAMLIISFSHYMTAGTTSSTTFKVRAGGTAGATMTFNGEVAARHFGGVCASSITITEIRS